MGGEGKFWDMSEVWGMRLCRMSVNSPRSRGEGRREMDRTGSPGSLKT